MIESRISSKSQTTVPKAVRTALGLKEGDRIAYEIDGNRAVLKRIGRSSDPIDNPYAMFTEWADDLDSAFDDL